MASGIYVPCYSTIKEHRKTYILAETLKIENYAAVGLVMCLSTWAAEYTQNGNITDFPPRAIATACGWSKRPDTLMQALLKSGYIDKTDEGMFVHDYREYAGKLDASREKTRARVRVHREKKDETNTLQEDDCNASVTVTGALRNRYPLETETVIEKEKILPSGNIQKKPENADPFVEDFDELEMYYRQNISYSPTKRETQALSKWMSQTCKEGVIYAIDQAVDNNAKKAAYISAIVNDLEKGGVKTKADLEKYKKRPIKRKASPALSYDQRPTDSSDPTNWM